MISAHKHLLRLLIIGASLLLMRCNGAITQGVEEYFNALLFEKSPYKDVLLEQYPDMGVLSLYLQAPGLNPAAPVEQCPANGNQAIQPLCDAETACAAKKGNQKLICLYDELKVVMKRSHSNREHRKHDDELSHEAWEDIKKLYERLQSIVHLLREGDDHDEEKYEEHADGDDHDEDDHDDDDTLVQKIQKFYATLRKIKQKYNNTDSIQILVDIRSVEVNHPERGWIRISTEKTKVNLANANLNDIISLDVLEPANYTGVRINFGDDNILRMAQAQSVATPAAGKTGDDDHDDHGKHTGDGHEDHGKGDDHKHSRVGQTVWKTYPLQFTDPSNRSVIMNDPFTITASKSTDFRFSFNINQSITTENDQFYFNPTVQVEGISGDAYQRPDQPTNVTLDSGAVSIVAEPGTFDTPVSLSATPVPAASAPSLPTEGEVLLTAYDMQPSMVFNKAVTVTMKYDPATLNATGLGTDNVRVKYFNEASGLWIDIPTFDVDPATRTVKVYTNHFTTIALFTQPGFTLNQPSEVAGRLQFSALTYLLNKILPNKLPELLLSHNLPTTSHNPLPDGYADATLTLKDIPIRDIQYSITPVAGTADQIRISLNIKRPIYIGQALASVYVNKGNHCSVEKSSCRSDCGRYWLRDLCYWGCDYAYAWCTRGDNLLNTNLNVWYDYHITNARLSLVYSIVHDPLTNSFRLVYQRPEFGNVNGQWMDLTSTMVRSQGYGSLSSIAVNLVNNFVVHYVNQFPGVQNDFSVTLAAEIAETVNEVLAESMPQISDFYMDTLGMAFKASVPVDINSVTDGLPTDTSNCSAPPNFPAVTNPANTTIDFPADTHLGVAYPIAGINQVFIELANRGVFCNKITDPVSGSQFTIEPTASPSLQYVGNYVMRVSLPIRAQLTLIDQTVSSYTGTIHFFFRVKINLGLRQLALAPFKVTYSFTDQEMTNLMDELSISYMNNLKPLIPQVDPTSYAGIHRSMYRIQTVEEHGGLLRIGLNIEGLKIDYGNQGRPYEWIWTKGWTAKTTGCGPFVTGTIVPSPWATGVVPGVSHAVRFDNMLTIPLLNRGIHPTLFNDAIGKKVSLSGSCAGKIFYADNILNDHFYTGAGYVLLNKSNYTAQMIDAYDTTIGLYSINITGNTVPEILQIREDLTKSVFLDWYPSNTCCSTTATEVTKYTMPLPQLNMDEGGIYRLSVMKQGAGYDQLLINCTVYDVQYGGGTVQLNPVQNFCQNEIAGVVLDDQNSLMWSKCSLGQELYDPNCGGTPLSFGGRAPATAACAASDLAGFNDWRLPTEMELSTLSPTIYRTTTFGAPAVASSRIDQTLFPATQGVYWTATGSSPITNRQALVAASQICKQKWTIGTITVSNNLQAPSAWLDYCNSWYRQKLGINYCLGSWCGISRFLWWFGTQHNGIDSFMYYDQSGDATKFIDLHSPRRCDLTIRQEPFCMNPAQNINYKRVRCVRNLQ